MRLTEDEKQLFEELISDLFYSEPVNQMKNYLQHGQTSTFDHCLNVAYVSFFLSMRVFKKLDTKSLVRGAFLHDFFLYDWHEASRPGFYHGTAHPAIALQNASCCFCLNKKEENIIAAHMWPLTLTKLPKCKESLVVCMVDKWCAIVETLCQKRCANLAK